jgi:hypothetical protein
VRQLAYELSDVFPELFVDTRGEHVLVRGYFPISDGEKTLDRFNIEVQLPKAGRVGLFTVRELGERLPRSPDRHVNDDGTLCVTLPHAYLYEHPEGMDLIQFLKGPLHDYLVAQCIVEHGGDWPAGEWAHGAGGIIEFYKGVFETEDVVRVVRYLDVLRHQLMKGHWTCPCGSGAIIRSCGCGRLEAMRTRIPPQLAEDAYRAVEREGMTTIRSVNAR